MRPVDEADETSVDPWSSHLPGPELVPNYLVSKFAAQYRVVVEVLLAAQDTSLTGMSFDDVAAAVRERLLRNVGDDVATQLLTDTRYHLDARLDQLEKWQVVTRWQEPARTGEDFLRRRDRYQLTPLAARLHTFWLEIRDGDDDESSEFTLAPRAIHERLAAFAEALAAQRFVAAANEFQQVAALHQAMARAARGWQRTLAHALSGGPDQSKQDLLWRTLQAYIGMWGEQVDTYSPRISDLIGGLSDRLALAEWTATVRAALVADAAEDLVQAQAQRWARTWDALASWFSGPDGQARRLRRQLRDLVAPWARNMHILVDTGGAVTRRSELLRLAEAIEHAPTEDDAWRIWNTAVGIFSARHLLVASDAAEDHAISWAEAPGAPITTRFREQGPRAAVGRRARAADYSKGRAAARRARAAMAATRAEAEARLRHLSGSRVSSWGTVTEAELDLFLELVGLTRPDSGPAIRNRTRSGTTADGRWHVVLAPPDAGPEVATLECARGRLVTVNWRFQLEPA
jgi:uncharacterized protein (TIGR02677 family)